MLTIDPHPVLDAHAFVTTFPAPLADMPTPASVLGLLSLEAAVPLSTDDHVREAVRQLLRHGGFKPTGRSKPASEYLIKAVREQQLGSINLAVDVCNAVSLHSGLPISVVDVDLAREPFRIGVAAAGTSYVFNQSGQVLDIGGLLCLIDVEGPCGSAVKDSQRTKTRPKTRRTLSIIWGTSALPERALKTAAWYRQLLEDCAAQTASA